CAIEDKRPNEEYSRQRNTTTGDISRQKRKGGEHETQKGATHVAHENSGGRPVVKEKADGRRSNHESSYLQERASQNEPCACPPNSGGRGLDSRDSINTIHEVVDV